MLEIVRENPYDFNTTISASVLNAVKLGLYVWLKPSSKLAHQFFECLSLPNRADYQRLRIKHQHLQLIL